MLSVFCRFYRFSSFAICYGSHAICYGLAVNQVSGVRFQVSEIQKKQLSVNGPALPLDSSSMTKSAKLPVRWGKIFLGGSERVSDLAGPGRPVAAG
jgi:hypothetical protein